MTNKMGSESLFPEFLPVGPRVVFLLHPVLNTLSLKEALRPQLFLMNFNLWYVLLLSIACLSVSNVIYVHLSWPWWRWPFGWEEWKKEYAEGAVRSVPGFWPFKWKSPIIATASLAKDLLLLGPYSYTLGCGSVNQPFCLFKEDLNVITSCSLL